MLLVESPPVSAFAKQPHQSSHIEMASERATSPQTNRRDNFLITLLFSSIHAYAYDIFPAFFFLC